MAEHDAVHVGQPSVEDGEVPRQSRQLAARLLAGCELHDFVAGAREIEVNEFANGCVVVDDRHPERLVGHQHPVHGKRGATRMEMSSAWSWPTLPTVG